MKKLLAIVCMLLLLCSAALAENSNVSYEGGAEKFLAMPQDDLFLNFKGVLPGDELTQTIQVKNNTDKKVRIYLRAEGASEEDKDFLNQMTLVVECGSKDIFDANADETAQLTQNTLLGTFNTKGSTDLTVTLKVPATLGNEYQNMEGIVPWTFIVEELPEDETPKTGDWFSAGAWIAAAVVLAAAIVLVLFGKRRRKA